MGFGHNNIVQNNTISNNRGKGLWLGYTYNPSNNNQIKNNKIMNNEEDGIHFGYGYASNNIIEGNIVSNNRDDGIDIRGRSYDNIIENNTILDNINFDIITYGTKTNIFNNTARRIHGDLVKNDIINNIYPRPTIPSTFTIDSPIIDGRMEDGEWLNKIEIKLNGFSNDDHYDGEENEKLTKTADLYVMNDAENIYIAIVLGDMVEEDEDFLRLEFDQGNDIIHTDGDEDMSSLCGLGYNDCHWNVDGWHADTNYHGEMVRRWSVTDRKYVYEFRKPLNSGDPQDMRLKAGDTVGFHIVAFDYYSGVGYRYPMDAVSFDVDPLTGEDIHSKDEDIIFTPPVGEESGAWKKWADLITGTELTLQPDLIVEDIWIEPVEFNPGDEVKLYARIKNIGNADAVGKFWWNRYIDGTFINHWYKNGLAAGDSTRTYKKYIWPTDCNTHTIKVVVDAKGNITESNEGNNERSERFSATPTPPPTPSPSPTSSPTPTNKSDLTVSGLIAYCIPPQDKITWIEFWVTNDGNAPASTEFSVSIAAYGKESVHNISYLAPGEGVHITDSSLFTFCPLPNPHICCGSDSTVVICADTTEVIQKSNEDNNCLVTYVRLEKCMQ